MTFLGWNVFTLRIGDANTFENEKLLFKEELPTIFSPKRFGTFLGRTISCNFLSQWKQRIPNARIWKTDNDTFEYSLIEAKEY